MDTDSVIYVEALRLFALEIMAQYECLVDIDADRGMKQAPLHILAVDRKAIRAYG